MKNYLRSLNTHIAIIPRFGAKIDYKNPQNIFILLENLALAIEDLSIIDNKLRENI